MINVSRRQPAPASLLKKKVYRNDEILEALHEDFLKKCYLTEFYFSDAGLMEVDHFVTQHDDPTHVRKYDWTNLYPIHDKANKKRLKSTPVGGYLDPCDQQDDVENSIIYKVHFSGGVSFQAKDINNLKAVNTAQLLTRVHQEFRGAIKEKHHEILDTLRERDYALKKGEIELVAEKEFLLRNLLSRQSSFTMLMRSITDIPSEFFD